MEVFYARGLKKWKQEAACWRDRALGAETQLEDFEAEVLDLRMVKSNVAKQVTPSQGIVAKPPKKQIIERFRAKPKKMPLCHKLVVEGIDVGDL
eukprot:15485140-Alexandrium_andersonii.AAC.1